MSHVRVVALLDKADGQRPENITLGPGGTAYVTFAFSRQVARIGPDAGCASSPPCRNPQDAAPPPS